MTPIAPTLPAGSAGECLWDAAVVGAGPAGALAACLLARQGKRVLLVDRSSFPRDKACGCCLNPLGAKLLGKLNLGSVLAGAARLDRLLLRLPSRSLEFTLPASLGLPRTIFDARLVQTAIDAGVGFLPSTSATLHGCDVSADSRELTLRSGATAVSIRSRIVLAADGLRGSTLDAYPQCAWQIARGSWFGISCTIPRALADFPAGAIAMHAAKHGYVGVIRLPDGQTHFAAALDPAACKSAGGPAGLLAEIFRACHLPAIADLEQATVLGTPLLTRQRLCLGAHRVLALGDAAAYVEPFSGEGMTWALQSAHLLSLVLPESLERWPADLPTQWTKSHRRLLAFHYRTCRLMRFLLHRPALLARAAFLVDALPTVGRILIDRVSSANGRALSGVSV